MEGIKSWLSDLFAPRPWWMNGLMVFCLFMAVVYMPWDMFVKPVAEDQEAWFGIIFTGWAAKATEPVHWAIYALGAYGFWRMRPWMWPWAAVYVAQVAFGMLLWPIVYIGGVAGFVLGVASVLPFGGLTLALWHAHDLFKSSHSSE